MAFSVNTRYSPLIDGFSVGGYRSFGSPQRIGPLSKANVFIGPNNCGKSNILRFVAEHLEWLSGAKGNSPQPVKLQRELDQHRGQLHPTVAGIGWRFDSHRIEEIRNRTQEKIALEFFDRMIRCDEISHGTDLVWFERSTTDLGSSFSLPLGADKATNELLTKLSYTGHEIDILFAALKAGWSGGSVQSRFKEIVSEVVAPPKDFPKTILIPAIRQVTSSQDNGDRWCGAGVVNKLAQLQNPSHHQQERKEAFRAIEALLRDVIGNPDAELEIPYERTSITIHMDGKSLPIESLGTGIHELIILAAACTTLDEHLICIEEPEIHLHPILQRKLVRYLTDNTKNQYFITTHSAALLDTELASVFEVTQEEKETKVRLASRAGDRWRVCRELGYKASDLMQANCVIWVEGPSDKIYLNHWIHQIDATLKENTHYLIMFYGGRLLSHLSADDEDVSEFISLCHINRNPAILIDSDKDTTESSLNDTKTRIHGEFSAANHYCWITQGREIENYVPQLTIQAAIDAVAGESSRKRKYGPFEKLVPKGTDKLKIARNVVSSPASLDVLNLRESIQGLVDYIIEANK